MSLFTRVLIPLDGSKLAEEALSHIDPSALPDDQELLMVTIVDPAVSRAFSDYAHAENISAFDAVEMYLNTIAAELTERGVNVRTIVEPDPDAGEGLLRVVSQENPTLVILSSHGRGAVGRLVLGSVAEKLMRRAECPLLVVPMR